MPSNTPEARTPLVLDVDGTLLKNDLTHELILKGVIKRFWKLPTLIKLTLTSKPALKLWLVEQVGTDIHPETLPYHQEIVELAKTAKAQGREVSLCSGSQEQLVQKLVDHLDWVDAGFGTTSTYNMTCENKAYFLQERYPQGFDYAGNSSQDFAVWKAARKGYGIEPPTAAATTRSQNGEYVKILKPRSSRARATALFEAMEPQYSVIFLTPFIIHALMNNQNLLYTLLMGIMFSFMFSTFYLLRNIAYISKDRRKPHSHQHTALSRGDLGIPTALISASICLVSGLACVGKALNSHTFLIS